MITPLGHYIYIFNKMLHSISYNLKLLHVEYFCADFFSHKVYILFKYKGYAGLTKKIRKHSLLRNFFKCLYRTNIIYFLNG